MPPDAEKRRPKMTIMHDKHEVAVLEGGGGKEALPLKKSKVERTSSAPLGDLISLSGSSSNKRSTPPRSKTGGGLQTMKPQFPKNPSRGRSKPQLPKNSDRSMSASRKKLAQRSSSSQSKTGNSSFKKEVENSNKESDNISEKETKSSKSNSTENSQISKDSKDSDRSSSPHRRRASPKNKSRKRFSHSMGDLTKYNESEENKTSQKDTKHKTTPEGYRRGLRELSSDLNASLSGDISSNQNKTVLRLRRSFSLRDTSKNSTPTSLLTIAKSATKQPVNTEKAKSEPLDEADQETADKKSKHLSLEEQQSKVEEKQQEQEESTQQQRSRRPSYSALHNTKPHSQQATLQSYLRGRADSLLDHSLASDSMSLDVSVSINSVDESQQQRPNRRRVSLSSTASNSRRRSSLTRKQSSRSRSRSRSQSRDAGTNKDDKEPSSSDKNSKTSNDNDSSHNKKTHTKTDGNNNANKSNLDRRFLRQESKRNLRKVKSMPESEKQEGSDLAKARVRPSRRTKSVSEPEEENTKVIETGPGTHLLGRHNSTRIMRSTSSRSTESRSAPEKVKTHHNQNGDSSRHSTRRSSLGHRASSTCSSGRERSKSRPRSDSHSSRSSTKRTIDKRNHKDSRGEGRSEMKSRSRSGSTGAAFKSTSPSFQRNTPRSLSPQRRNRSTNSPQFRTRSTSPSVRRHCPSPSGRAEREEGSKTPAPSQPKMDVAPPPDSIRCTSLTLANVFDLENKDHGGRDLDASSSMGDTSAGQSTEAGVNGDTVVQFDPSNAGSVSSFKLAANDKSLNNSGVFKMESLKSKHKSESRNDGIEKVRDNSHDSGSTTYLPGTMNVAPTKSSRNPFGEGRLRRRESRRGSMDRRKSPRGLCDEKTREPTTRRGSLTIDDVFGLNGSENHLDNDNSLNSSRESQGFSGSFRTEHGSERDRSRRHSRQRLRDRRHRNAQQRSSLLQASGHLEDENSGYLPRGMIGKSLSPPNSPKKSSMSRSKSFGDVDVSAEVTTGEENDQDNKKEDGATDKRRKSKLSYIKSQLKSHIHSLQKSANDSSTFNNDSFTSNNGSNLQSLTSHPYNQKRESDFGSSSMTSKLKGLLKRKDKRKKHAQMLGEDDSSAVFSVHGDQTNL